MLKNNKALTEELEQKVREFYDIGISKKASE